ncbi:type ISP restriction/modification enzyme, partial [Chromatium okenii]|uniref:type ISP restriction/modification enzyme n=1 Tax=Chromatium okenii TaxID=61644 RepID=UPI0026EC1A6A
AYYEATQEWREFNGACFVNTLENWGFDLAHEGSSGHLFGSLTDENQARIRTQNQRTIPVILGNPPYNANQKNENDNNKNDPALLADKRIKETYISESTAQKTKLYDPYVRFLRWASDRIGERGIVAFISNSSFIEAKGFDGFRKVIAQEFQAIWIVNIKGNARTSGDRRRREGGNVFDDKIRVGVALYFLVRNPALTDDCDIRYFELADFLIAKEKRAWLAHHQLHALAKAGDFNRIRPNAHGTWLNQPQEDWSEWLAVASKEGKAGKSEDVIFKLYSLGVVTARDEWVYGFTHEKITKRVKYLINHYEDLRLNSSNNDGGIKWTREVKNDLVNNVAYTYNDNLIVKSLYRPFFLQRIYFCSKLNNCQYRQKEIFGLGLENIAIGISGIPIIKPFQTLAASVLPDYHLLEQPKFLPLWVYAADGSQHDNITNWALTQFQQHYTNTEITKRAIFNYVYAVLHDPRYRHKFALNLKAEFPRIPFHPDFTQWADIGATLIDCHAYFERVKPFGLKRMDRPTVTPKCRLKADKTAGTIDIDGVTILEEIPPQAWQYQLGNRSALEWVLDQYKEKTPKDLTIREHFNTYRFAEHKEAVIELLDRVCQVSVDTMTAIEQIEQLP